jgi:hypothetical protein
MKRNIVKILKSKFSSLTINDSLGSISEPAISTSTADPVLSGSDCAPVSATSSTSLRKLEATMDQHEDISSAGSDLLEVMGTTVRSQMSWDQHTITEETNSASQHIRRVNADAEVGAGSHTEEMELDELSKQMEVVQLYASNKSVGALTLSLIGPHSHSARVSTHVYWDGRKPDDIWDDQEKGFMKNSHATFG